MTSHLHRWAALWFSWEAFLLSKNWFCCCLHNWSIQQRPVGGLLGRLIDLSLKSALPAGFSDSERCCERSSIVYVGQTHSTSGSVHRSYSSWTGCVENWLEDSCEGKRWPKWVHTCWSHQFQLGIMDPRQLTSYKRQNTILKYQINHKTTKPIILPTAPINLLSPEMPNFHFDRSTISSLFLSCFKPL